MGKDKKEKRKSEGGEDADKEARWEELVTKVSPIANPLASRKLTRKLYKIIKKANQQKCLHKGVREVQKVVRKGGQGVLIFAGDVSPLEVICHMPAVCEAKDLAYCYTPSKDDLGAACGSKRPTCMVMVKKHTEYQELYDDLQTEVKSLPMPF